MDANQIYVPPPIFPLYIFSSIQTFSIFSSWPGCTSGFLCQLCSSVEIVLPLRDSSCDAFIEKQSHSLFLWSVKLNKREWLLAEDHPTFPYNCCNLQIRLKFCWNSVEILLKFCWIFPSKHASTLSEFEDHFECREFVRQFVEGW